MRIDFALPPEQTGRIAALTEEVSPVERRLAQARRVFEMQAQVLDAMAERLDASFSRAVQMLMATPGKVIVSGMGKSGHIGRKIAATLASTGTPSFFVHPGEALHGDLGMITAEDTVVLISNGGETEEVTRLLPALKRMEVPVVAMVGKPESTLATAADVVLDISVEQEACPHNLAPTNSTLATMAMGDALAVALMNERDFRPVDFARVHPGGSLGRRLLTRVRDVMRDEHLPVVSPDQTVGESLFVITRGRLGLALVIENERLVGIVTDGDLRRAMQKYEHVLEVPISRVMNLEPVTVSADAMLVEAEELMRLKKIKALVAVDGDEKVVGLLEIYD